MAKMSKAAHLELIRRLREDGPQAYIAPWSPVHLIGEQLPPTGLRVKVWWKPGNGTSGEWNGREWTLRHEGDVSHFGNLVKWQELPALIHDAERQLSRG